MEFEYIDIAEVKHLTQFELTDEFSFEFIDESELEVKEKAEKIESFFPYGSRTKEITYRTYWGENDQELLYCLVKIKVNRANKRGKIAILDEIREFRLLTSILKNNLCDDLKLLEFKFVVYFDEAK